MNPNPNANPPVDPASSSTPMSPGPSLQRGKACLACRRRKMKCDGAKPVCTPCLRGERTEDCEYTDGPHRPRTLTLEEDVARLRARVWELENPGEAAPHVELYDPYVGAVPSVRSARPQLHHPPPPAGTSSRGLLDDVPVDFHHALSTVVPYATELGFFLDLDRLRIPGTYVLPALQSSVALWSLCITAMASSELGHAQAMDLSSKLLTRAQAQLASALSTVDAEPDPSIFLQIIQTGVLLAYFMQRLDLALGARYYASGTWAVAMLLKLYRNPYAPLGGREEQGQAVRRGGTQETWPRSNADIHHFAFTECAKLPPALDGIEAEERTRAFWAVYTLDRWFAALGQGPCQSVMTDGSAVNAITVPWPGTGRMQVETRSNVIQDLLDDPSHDFTRDHPSAIHAMASVLLGEAATIATSFLADNTVSQSSEFQAGFGRLDALLERSLTVAMTIAIASSHERGSQTQQAQPAVGLGQALVTVHLLALAQVTLHRPFISTYGLSRRRCVEGAMGTVRVLDRLGELGLRGGLCPTIPIVWTVLCLTLHDEIRRLRARPDADPSRRRDEGMIISAIRNLVGRLSTLSQQCPGKFFASKIEAVLPVVESIAP